MGPSMSLLLGSLAVLLRQSGDAPEEPLPGAILLGSLAELLRRAVEAPERPLQGSPTWLACGTPSASGGGPR